MKSPRDLSGLGLAQLLHRFGYEITRQTGSHLQLTCSLRDKRHHITIPAHRNLKVGTLAGILKQVAGFVDLPRADLERELFGE